MHTSSAIAGRNQPSSSPAKANIFRKAMFIDRMTRGEIGGRSIDDVGVAALS